MPTWVLSLIGITTLPSSLNSFVIMSTASSFCSLPARPAKLHVSSLRDRKELSTSATVSIMDMYSQILWTFHINLD